MQNSWRIAALSLALWNLGEAAEPAPAPAPAPSEDRWRLTTTPYLWFSGIEGDVTIRGITADLDLGFDDLFDATEYAFASYFELRKNKFGFFAAPSYVKFSADAKTRLADADFEQDFWIVQGGGFYNLIHTQGERPLELDATAGVRYWNIATDVDVDGQGPLGGTLKLSSSTELTDPFIGLRAQKYLTEKLSLHLQGNIGGFGISEGETSDFSWEALGLVGYDLGKRFTIFGGYRGLGVDTSEGSGTKEKGFDVVMHGALMGLSVHW